MTRNSLRKACVLRYGLQAAVSDDGFLFGFTEPLWSLLPQLDQSAILPAFSLIGLKKPGMDENLVNSLKNTGSRPMCA
jgi:hypothetical protein